MTLTIPTTHAAVSDNPRFPVLAECPRERVALVRMYGYICPVRLVGGSIGGHVHASVLASRNVTDWRLVRDPLAPVDVCEWCRQHVCRVCLGKHRRCRQRCPRKPQSK